MTCATTTSSRRWAITASSTGSRFRAEIAPRILDFMRTHARGNRNKKVAPKVIKGGRTG